MVLIEKHMKKIIFVTGNATKILHANTALKEFGYEVIGQKMSLIEPREEEPEQVVIKKAIQAFSQINKPLIVEDSGIFIKALNGFPKTYIHFVQETIGVKNILKMMEGVTDRGAEFRQSLAYIEAEMSKPQVFNYTDGGFTVADKVWEDGEEDGGEFDKILIPRGQVKPLSMFSKEWRAKRDVEQNKDQIHYHQLAKWLAVKRN